MRSRAQSSAQITMLAAGITKTVLLTITHLMSGIVA